jgi:hypothetical protein
VNKNPNDGEPVRARGDGDDELYIGWQAAAPGGLARGIRLRVIALLAATTAVGVVLALTHAPASSARFEYGVVRSFTGRLEHVPYPTLVVTRPGMDASNAAGSTSCWLLTVFGKRGADGVTAAFDGHDVRCEGSLIHRDGVTMVELLPDTLVDLGVSAATRMNVATAGELIRLEGEIVDAKCFLGVMKPGELKTHRACAARCISGGVPPVLLVRDAEGCATYHLLVDEAGGAVNQRVLHLVAEPIAVEGRRVQRGGLSILYADPRGYRRL